jgi:hypothetical protein
MTSHPAGLMVPLVKEIEKQVLAGCVAPASTCFSKDSPPPSSLIGWGRGQGWGPE